MRAHSPIDPGSPPTDRPSLRTKRSSSINVLVRLLSVDWAIERQTITVGPSFSRVERRAYFAAVRIRTFIVGASALAGSSSRQLSKSDMKKLRASLEKPEEAKRIIAHLRTLPSHPDHDKLSAVAGKPSLPAPPLHAACLSVTDEQAEAMHFSKLVAVNPLNTAPPAASTSNKASTPHTTTRPKSAIALESALGSMNLVSLIAAPDLGLGHPASDPGIFSGAVPSAQEIGNGVEEVGRTLLALGFAGSGMVWPDHTGVYPPTDTLSCYTYWWGYELVLPHQSVMYLSKCKSVSGTMMDFLTALALFTEGVREILPFIRYISQFVDMEFDDIAGQDQGKGVVCAATWLIPVALVPRSWDFPPRPHNLPSMVPVAMPILGTGSRSSGPLPSSSMDGPDSPQPVQASPSSPPTVVPNPALSPTIPTSITSVSASIQQDTTVPPVSINPVAAQLAVTSLALGACGTTPSAPGLLAGISPVAAIVH
ncbi:hypothetical protein CALCODRAFT_463516 [Calocera cornea HHB12733]|uniref:Uncharacterized protein n=1 Tax=Calocera cornea HHB12733 TaxID=1353952 RepID=A0A165JN11_9BASI|nr:hypothetical protein CALCODRAFT_463516 [Calocera cornea HHB12733]